MAKKLTDVPGFGPKTERELRKAIGSRPTSRLGTELDVNEVARHREMPVLKAKLNKTQKENLAKEIGRAVGGVPNPSPVPGVGGGSKIPDGHSRKGDFLVEEGSREEAVEAFKQLPKSRRVADKKERARV